MEATPHAFPGKGSSMLCPIEVCSSSSSEEECIIKDETAEVQHNSASIPKRRPVSIEIGDQGIGGKPGEPADAIVHTAGVTLTSTPGLVHSDADSLDAGDTLIGQPGRSIAWSIGDPEEVETRVEIKGLDVVQSSSLQRGEDVKVCNICGDIGFGELLKFCSSCSGGAEHIYCVPALLRAHKSHTKRNDGSLRSFLHSPTRCEGCEMKAGKENQEKMARENNDIPRPMRRTPGAIHRPGKSSSKTVHSGKLKFLPIEALPSPKRGKVAKKTTF